jgi:RNA polymerase sigma factor (sigma-70 family)
MADIEAVPGRYLSPEDIVVRREQMGQAKEFMSSLSARDQQIAFLHFFEEMTYGQISTVMSTPVGTIKYRVHRIRQIAAGEEKLRATTQ